jgi:hypothetical protein
VGYLSRVADALFSLSLLLRGRVPGDQAAAARLGYRRIPEAERAFRYHGRVLRQNGWVVLQYWFFYLFNNWRSAFFGANDHEADWEMICIYLSEREDASDASMEDREPLAYELARFRPEWVAFASHDYHGDDLRRRWDDPEVQKLGSHPVVYAGAGSHASYFSPGEYLTELELPFLTPVIRLTDRLQEFGRKQLRQYAGDDPAASAAGRHNIFRIPFVDYARGDGLSIGPGQPQGWQDPRMLSPTPAWVSEYRGLWGLYAADPFSGENAPAGPMYNRDGSVRRAWYDPLGWAGLDKVTPPDEELARVRAQQDEVRQRVADLEQQVAEKDRRLQGLGIEVVATRDQPHLATVHAQRQREVNALSAESDRQRSQITREQALLRALEQHTARLLHGERGPARSHIRRAHQPASESNLRASRLAEIWSAASIGLSLIVFVAIFYLARQYLVVGLILLIALLTFIEAGFRGLFTRLVTSVTFALAVVAGLVLIYEFFWHMVVLTVLAVGAYILWENVRELWHER